MDNTDKLTHLEFTRKAIVALRTGKYKGIHSVFSGFNTAFRTYFPDDDVIETINTLADSGEIVSRRSKKGCMLYLKDDAPNSITPVDVFAKMGITQTVDNEDK